jgi:hypothetical protein
MIRWLGQLPAGVLFPLMIVVGIAVTLGLDMVIRHFVAEETRQRATTTAAVALQVTATIYAILIAFVIVDEYTQLRAAQSQVSDKSAQLSAIFENSRGLPQPGGARVQQATLAYAHAVVDHGFPHLESSATPDATTDHAIERLYRAAQRIEPRTPSQQAAYDQVIKALDGLVSTRANLVSSARSTIPAALFWLLAIIGLTVMSIAALLDTRHRSSHLYILSALALVIWVTLALVVSMDYAFGGIIRVSDGPIREFIHFRAAR